MTTQENIDAIKSLTDVEYPRIRSETTAQLDATSALITAHQSSYDHFEPEPIPPVVDNGGPDYGEYLTAETKKQADWVEQYKADMATGNF